MRMGFIAQNDLEGIEADCQFAVANGYEGLEFNYWGNFKDVDESLIGRMRAILDRHGVQCSTLGFWGWNHISADAAERAAAAAQFEKAIGLAVKLGAPVLITGGGKHEGETVEAMLSEWIEVTADCRRRTVEAGLKLALYGFHGGSCLDTVDAYASLLSQVPEVGVKFDPANIDKAGEDYIRLLHDHGDRVAHVHLKEHVNHEGQVISQPAAGMGDIHWGKVMAFLYEHGYAGYLTAEPHGPKWSRGELRHTMLKLTRRYIGQFLL